MRPYPGSQVKDDSSKNFSTTDLVMQEEFQKNKAVNIPRT